MNWSEKKVFWRIKFIYRLKKIFWFAKKFFLYWPLFTLLWVAALQTTESLHEPAYNPHSQSGMLLISIIIAFVLSTLMVFLDWLSKTSQKEETKSNYKI